MKNLILNLNRFEMTGTIIGYTLTLLINNQFVNIRQISTTQQGQLKVKGEAGIQEKSGTPAPTLCKYKDTASSS